MKTAGITFRRVLSFWLFISTGLLYGCNNQEAIEVPITATTGLTEMPPTLAVLTPSMTAHPATPTLVATITPSETAVTSTITGAPTSVGPIFMGDEITISNADLVQELGLLAISANEITWSPDGKLLAIATDGGVIIMEIPSLQERMRIASKEEWFDLWISSVAFHPTDDRLLLGGRGFFQQWDLATGEALHRTHGTGSDVFDVDYSEDGDLIAVGFRDGVLVKDIDFDLPAWVLRPESHTLVTGKVTFAPHGAKVAGLGDDGYLRLWNARTRELLWERSTEFQGGWDLAYSPDGRFLVVGGSATDFLIFDAQNGQDAAVLSLESTKGISSLAFNPESNLLALGTWEGQILIWDLEKLRLVTQLEGYTEGFTSLAFSPDGRLLASAGYDDTIRLWGIPPEP